MRRLPLIAAVIVAAASACGSSHGAGGENTGADGSASSGSSSGGFVSSASSSGSTLASDGGSSSGAVDGGPSSSGDSSGAAKDASGSADAGPVPGTCNPDPLRTGLTALQTGVSVDAFDCAILKWSAAYGEPDPMIFKAIIYVESRFDAMAVACPNLPCGTPSGWTATESGCFGLMQVVPACGGATNSPVLQPNGHPDLEKDAAASDWPGSVFNADANVHVGIAGVADNRRQVQMQFPGCTVDQYTMMAIGNYNSYGTTMSCTVYNTSYDNSVLQAYRQYASAAGYAAHGY